MFQPCNLPRSESPQDNLQRPGNSTFNILLQVCAVVASPFRCRQGVAGAGRVSFVHALPHCHLSRDTANRRMEDSRRCISQLHTLPLHQPRFEFRHSLTVAGCGPDSNIAANLPIHRPALHLRIIANQKTVAEGLEPPGRGREGSTKTGLPTGKNGASNDKSGNFPPFAAAL
ncbi:hypothetical protein VTK26DRAFT_1915 [Humicola hyalothermophila]